MRVKPLNIYFYFSCRLCKSFACYILICCLLLFLLLSLVLLLLVCVDVLLRWMMMYIIVLLLYIHQQYKLCKITFINQSNSYAHFIKKMYTLHDNNQGQFKFCNFFFPYPKICIVLSLKHCISKLLFCFRLIIHYLYK